MRGALLLVACSLSQISGFYVESSTSAATRQKVAAVRRTSSLDVVLRTRGGSHVHSVAERSVRTRGLRVWVLVAELLRCLRRLLLLRHVRMQYVGTSGAIGKRVPPQYRGELATLRQQVKARPGLEARAKAVGHELSEPTLSRYMEATYWVLERDGQSVVSNLADTISWRESYGANCIAPAEARAADGGAGVFFVHGRDKFGRPVVYIRPGMLPPGRSADATMKSLVYTLERAVRAMPPGVEEISFVIDCRGFGLARLPPIGFLRAAFACLMAHYPLRIGVIVMANTGASVQVAWRVVSPLVTERTKRKMRFVSEQHAASQLTRLIAPEQLLESVGGRDRWTYDPDAYYKGRGC